MTKIEEQAVDLIHDVMDERGLRHRRFHNEDTREDSFILEAMCRVLESAEKDRAALQRAIDALIKISEPRVGGGRWAAAIALEALDTMTCAGEAA